MQINDLALFELFLETVCEASAGDTVGRQRTATELDTPRATSLAQQLGNCENLMEHLAVGYEASGLHKLAHATRRLAGALSDDNLPEPDEQDDRKRLLDYVYPVV